MVHSDTRNERARERDNRHQALVLEFPNPDIPRWVLNFGVKFCRDLQRMEGLERLSFNQMLTVGEVKVQQYALYVMNRLRDNLNGPPGNRDPNLEDAVRVRAIGRLKQHLVLMDRDGDETKRAHYNNLITDSVMRPYLPVEGGEVVTPPTDYTYEPRDTSLLQVDYRAEATRMGTTFHGRKEGIALKVPDFVTSSLRKRAMEGDESTTNKNPQFTGGNNETVGVRGRNPQGRWNWGSGRGNTNRGEHSNRQGGRYSRGRGHEPFPRANEFTRNFYKSHYADDRDKVTRDEKNEEAARVTPKKKVEGTRETHTKDEVRERNKKVLQEGEDSGTEDDGEVWIKVPKKKAKNVTEYVPKESSSKTYVAQEGSRNRLDEFNGNRASGSGTNRMDNGDGRKNYRGGNGYNGTDRGGYGRPYRRGRRY